MDSANKVLDERIKKFNEKKQLNAETIINYREAHNLRLRKNKVESIISQNRGIQANSELFNHLKIKTNNLLIESYYNQEFENYDNKFEIINKCLNDKDINYIKFGISKARILSMTIEFLGEGQEEEDNFDEVTFRLLFEVLKKIDLNSNLDIIVN